MRIRAHYLFVAFAWLLLIPVPTLDAMVFENPETRPFIATEVTDRQALENHFRFVSAWELMILTAGVFIGARLHKLELEVGVRPLRARLLPVVDDRRLGQ
jgi:hypothetical protein